MPGSVCMRIAWLLVVPVVFAACGSAAEGGDGSSAEPAPEATVSDPAVSAVTVEQVESSPVDVTVSGLDIGRGGSGDDAPEPLVDVDEIRSGGPPPDGIPPIDEPRFVATAEADFLADNEPVIALEIDGDARAYPVQILTWHEIVNDTVGGVPVAVTYCPLCNSALTYDRRVDDRVLDFGTSGLLWNSALVMYDRQTESLWSHFTGTAVVGELTGTELETFPSATVPWGLWRDEHPDGLVLSQDTGFNRSYGRNPYPGYDDVNSRPFLFEGEVDGRYTAMTRLVGVEIDGEALGVPLQTLRDDRVVAAAVGDTDVVVFWQPGTASALDTADIANGDDVGATGVFLPVIDGQELTFAATDAGFVDDQTGSTWNLLGTALAGPLAGQQLAAIAHVDTFWFAWGAFRPDSAVVGS